MTEPKHGPWRVLEVLHDYLPEHIGGTELIAHQLAQYLQGQGHEVRVLFTERDLSAEEGELRRGEFEGVPTLELVYQREYAHVRESYAPKLGPQVLRKVIEEYRPHVVHFQHLAFFSSKAIQVARSMGCAVVVSLHDFWLLCDAAVLMRPDESLCKVGPVADCGECLRHYPNPDLKPGDRLADFEWVQISQARRETHRQHLAMAHRVITPSQFLRDQFVAAGLLTQEDAIRLKTGYPGPIRALPGVRRGTLRVGYVGGLYPSKGVHVAVEAMTHLVERDIELIVNGVLEWFPEYVDGLKRTAEGCRVVFAGGYEPGEVDAVMGQLDLLVVPSIWYENMPLAIHEAFRNGLPVVATAHGGMAETVKDGVWGRTFPRGDAEALARILAELDDDREELARLAAARPPVVGVPEIGARFEAMYAEALAEVEAERGEAVSEA